MSESGDSISGAISSGAYRYLLWRTWDAQAQRLLWVLLNPSTADGQASDPTLRRCIGFSRRWGYGGLVIANLFALRTPDPHALRAASGPIGSLTDYYLSGAASHAAAIVVGWGALGTYLRRDRDVLQLLARHASCPVLCLGAVANGCPRHPLYVAGSTRPVPYVPEGPADVTHGVEEPYEARIPPQRLCLDRRTGTPALYTG